MWRCARFEIEDPQEVSNAVVRIALAAALVGCAPVHAQWLNYLTPGVPRLPNGKANLNAPAPHTAEGKPDLSGLWELVGPANSSFVGNSARDPQFADVGKDVKGGLPLQPWAADLLKTRLAANSKDDPDSCCLPLGPSPATNARSDLPQRLKPYSPSTPRTIGMAVNHADSH